MQRHNYSIIIRDVSWSDIGNAIDSVKQLDSDDSIELLIRHDTSGGTLDDGTTYQTETSFSATYSYALGDGDAALTDFAMKLSQLPPLPDDSAMLKTEIKERG